MHGSWCRAAPAESHRDIPKSAVSASASLLGMASSKATAVFQAEAEAHTNNVAWHHDTTHKSERRWRWRKGAPDVEVHGVGLKRCLTHARVTAQCICPPKERWSSGISPTSFRASSQPDQGPGCDPGTSGTHNWRPPRAVRRRAATAEATALRLPRPRLHADMRIVHMRTTAKNVPAGIGWYIASYQATALHRLLSQVRMAHIFGEPPPPKPRASAL